MSEEETVEEEPQEEQALSWDALQARIAVEEDTVLIEGCRVRGLNAVDYQRLQAHMAQAALAGDADTREEERRISEQCAWLAYGVVEPEQPPDQWQFVLRSASAGKIEHIISRIQELTGVGSFEIEFAKKLLPSITDMLPNSLQPPSSSTDTPAKSA